MGTPRAWSVIAIAGVLAAIAAMAMFGNGERQPSWLVGADAVAVDGQVLDVSRLGQSVAVLSDRGEITLIELGKEVARVVRPRLAADSDSAALPFSVRLQQDGLQLWYPTRATLARTDGAGNVVEVRRFPIDDADLRAGLLYPMVPPRLHGRAKWSRTSDDPIVELRTLSEESPDAPVSTFLVRLGWADGVVDTIARLRTASYARPFIGRELCCGLPRYFTPQAIWDVTDAGLLAFSGGLSGSVRFAGSPGAASFVFPVDTVRLGRADLRVGIRNEDRRYLGYGGLRARVSAWKVARFLPSTEYGVYPTSPTARNSCGRPKTFFG